MKQVNLTLIFDEYISIIQGMTKDEWDEVIADAEKHAEQEQE